MHIILLLLHTSSSSSSSSTGGGEIQGAVEDVISGCNLCFGTKQFRFVTKRNRFNGVLSSWELMWWRLKTGVPSPIFDWLSSVKAGE
jgi:hypothetical protein